MPGKIEQPVDIGCRNDALDYFGDDLTLRFRSLLGSDVFDRADMTGDGAVIADDSRFASHPADIAVRRLKAKLHVELASLLRRLLPFRDHNGGVGRMDRVGPALAKAFFQR